ncbi:MAG: GAF domain-containing protein [Ardenticatenaceae bacterium]
MISNLTRTINQSISAKLRWSFGIIILITIMVGGLSIFALWQLNTLVQESLPKQNHLVRDVADLLDACRMARFHERDFALQARTLGVEEARTLPYSRWNESIVQMGEIIDKLKTSSLRQAQGTASQLSNPSQQETQIGAIDKEYQSYKQNAEELFATYEERGDNRNGALAEWMSSTQALDELRRRNVATIEEDEENEEQAPNREFNEQLMALRSKQLSYLGTETDADDIQKLYKELQVKAPPELQEEFAREGAAFGQFYKATSELRAIQTKLETDSIELEQQIRAFRLQLTHDVDQYVTTLNEQYRFYIALIVVSMLIALALAFWLVGILSQQLIKPVLVLADAANKIRAGKQGIRASILSKDEVGSAAKAFNKMASQLDELLFNLEVRVAQRTAQLETAAEVAAAASTVRELTPLLNLTINLLVERFDNIYHAQIFLIDEQGRGEWNVLRASTGETGQSLLARNHRLAVGSKSVIGQVTTTGEYIIARPDDTDTVYRPNDLLPDTACELALPMKREGRVIGALDVQSKIKDAFNEDDVTVLQILADQLTIAVENARLFGRLNHTIEETELLFQASRGIMTASNQDGILDILTDVAQSSKQMDRFTILFFDQFDADGNPIGARSMRSWTRAEGVITQNNRFVMASVINQIWRTLKSGVLEVPDISKYASLDNRLYQVFAALGTQSFAVVPLQAAGSDLGVMLLQRQVADPLPKALTRIFSLLAKQAAIGLNRFALLEQYQKQVEELQDLQKSFLELSACSRDYFEVGNRSGTGSLEPLWNVLAQRATTLVNAHASIVYSYNQAQDVMEVVGSSNIDEETLQGIRLGRGEGAAGLFIEQSDPVLIDNYARWNNRSMQLPEQTGAVAAVPVIWQEQLLGAVSVVNLREQRRFDKNDERRLSLLANQAALTIDNIRLLSESQHAAKQLSTAAEVSRAASMQLDVKVMLMQAVNLIKEQFGHYHVQVFLLDENKLWANLRASTGVLGQTLLAKKHRLGVGSRSVIGEVTARGTHLVARSVDIDPNTLHLRNQLLDETRTELALPMKIGEEVIGALDVQSVNPFAFTDSADIEIFQTLANQLAVAVQNARLFERTERTLRQSQALYEAGRAISKATSLEEILTALLDHVAPIDASHISLFAVGLNERTGMPNYLRVEAIVTSSKETHLALNGASPKMATIKNLVGRVYPISPRQRFIIDHFQQGEELLVIHDTTHDARIDSITRSIYDEQNIQAAIVASLPAPRIEGQPFILHVSLPQARHILPSEVELLAPIVTQTGIAIQNLYLVANLAERTQRLDRANLLASQLLVVDTLAKLTELAAREITKLMNVDQTGIVLFKEELGVGEVVAQYKVDGQASMIGEQFPLANAPSIKWLQTHRRPLAISNLENDPLLIPGLALVKSQGIRSILLIPLFVRGELIGSIGLDAIKQQRNWSDIDISLAQNLSNLVASAIDRTRLFEQIRSALEQTQTLYRASRAINEAKSKNKIAEAIAEHVVGASDATVTLITLELDANELIKEARIEASYLPFRESEAPSEFVLDDSFITANTEHRTSIIKAPKWRDNRLSDRILEIVRRLDPVQTPIMIANAEQATQLSKKEKRFLHLLGIGAFISVPIRLPNWRGLILVTYDRPRLLTPGDGDRLAAIATQAATTMQNRELLIGTRVSLTESQRLYQASVLLGESQELEGLLKAIYPLSKPIDPDQIVLLLFDQPVREGERPINFTVQAELTIGQELLPKGKSYRVREFPLFKWQPVNMPLICEDIQRSDLLEEEERNLLRKWNLQALLYLPLRTGAGYIGWVGFNAAEARTMEPGTVRSLQTIAQQVAIALQNQQLLAEAQRRAWREEQISHITTRLHSTTDPEQIMDIALQELKRTLKIKRAKVSLHPNRDSLA